MINIVSFLVIGGGAAGLMGALSAQRAGLDTVILEKGPKTGRKLAVSGGGRGNFCNTGCWRNTEALSRKEDKKRLISMDKRFPVEELRAFMAEIGVPSVTEAEGRVFPKSHKASDIGDALKKAFEKAGGRIVYGASAEYLSKCEEGWEVRLADGRVYRAGKLLLASGGASYPQTGSEGDALRFFRALGLSCRAFTPALCALRLRNGFGPGLEGVSLEDAGLFYTLKQKRGERKVRARGPVMWQKKGLSGPLILNHAADLFEDGLESCELSFLPDETDESLAETLRAYGETYPKRQVCRYLREILPGRLADHIWQNCAAKTGCREELTFAELSRQVLKELCGELLRRPLLPASPPPVEQAMASRGGLDPDELNWRTCEIKKCPGLYAAGECVDIDFISGGYHLCFAFQSGRQAGLAAAGEL